jgi:hypothetical protein
MWKKVQRQRATGGAPRTKFGVRRNKTGIKSAFLILPKGTTDKTSVSIYSDGQGKIALSFSDVGEFKVGKSGSTQLITIPHQFSALVPYGTRDCAVMWDDAMLVVDLTQFQPKAVAAE